MTQLRNQIVNESHLFVFYLHYYKNNATNEKISYYKLETQINETNIHTESAIYGGSTLRRSEKIIVIKYRFIVFKMNAQITQSQNKKSHKMPKLSNSDRFFLPFLGPLSLLFISDFLLSWYNLRCHLELNKAIFYDKFFSISPLGRSILRNIVTKQKVSRIQFDIKCYGKII